MDENPNILETILTTLSSYFFFYAIIRLILLATSIDKGGTDMIEISDGIWSAIGAGSASIITTIGAFIVQKMKERKDTDTIKDKISNVKENIGDVKLEVKDARTEVKETKSEIRNKIDGVDKILVKDVKYPVKDILSNSKETKAGIDFLVSEQKVRNRIKEESNGNNTELMVMSYVEKLVEEKNKLAKDNYLLQSENKNLQFALQKNIEETKLIQKNLANLQEQNEYLNNLLCEKEEQSLNYEDGPEL